mgnify:CR=1 FL=1
MITIEDVERLAELARIEMSAQEKEEILKDMDSIVGYVKTIEGVDVGEVKPHQDVYNVWREDETRAVEEDERKMIIDQFPNKQGDYLKVKKIL